MNAEPSTPTASEKDYFEARYAPWVGITLLIIGLVNVVISALLILLSAEFSTTIITGVLVTAVGILYLTRPYFVVAPNRITLYSLIGSAVKRYVYASPAELRLENNKLYINSTDSDFAKPSAPQPVKIARWLTRAEDWKRLETIVKKEPAS